MRIPGLVAFALSVTACDDDTPICMRPPAEFVIQEPEVSCALSWSDFDVGWQCFKDAIDAGQTVRLYGAGALDQCDPCPQRSQRGNNSGLIGDIERSPYIYAYEVPDSHTAVIVCNSFTVQTSSCSEACAECVDPVELCPVEP